MKRVQPLIILTLFIVGLFFVPGVGMPSQTRLQSTSSVANMVNEKSMADLPNDPIFRVALYNETNTTVPAYHPYVTLNNNYTAIHTLLTSAGYDVDILTFQDILDYELTTANYDVLVLADNLPRENITNHVKDFWLAGGGVLSLDSSLAYLAFGGILYRENESISDGYPEMWVYNFDENSTVLESHPVTQSYQIGDILEVSTSPGKACLKKEAFNQTTVWSQTTILAEVTVDPDRLRAVAVDAFDRGGRVVHIGTAGGGNTWSADWEDMIVDAIAWLAPKPKARIAFDFSHQPRLYVDPWDEFATTGNTVNSFTFLRDTYVSHRYTFDKFIPAASGNFTEARLAEYDIMIVAWPDLNFTVAERTGLMNWLSDGGGLIVLGDRTVDISYKYLNFLLADLDMYLGENNTLDIQTATVASPRHPTTEDCDGLQIQNRNYIYLSGPEAVAIWEYNDNIAVAAQEYGSGRVMLSGDNNIFDNGQLVTEDNQRYAINVANWLSADDARVLLYSDDPYGGSYYRNIVSDALNQLEISFYHISTEEGLNYTLNGTWYGDNWDLVIIDNCDWGIQKTYPHILNYLKTGKEMILTSWTLSWYRNDPLWAYIGVNATGHWPSNQPGYIWDASHPIFDGLVSYSAPTFNVSNAAFGTDGATLDVYDNATALAGYTATEQDGNASIVLTNTGQVLLNGFLLNNLQGDIDESGYVDGFEIYINEIAFMLGLPEIDHPADVQYEAGSTGNSITWNPTDSSPDTYEIIIDGTSGGSSSWSGSSITADIDGLGLGQHIVECRVVGESGYPRGDIVIVTVVDTTDPLLNSPPDKTIYVGTTGNTLTWLASDPNPSHYVITMNTTPWEADTWDGSSVVLDLDDLDIGIYFFTIRVNDTLGHESEDTVLVTVAQGGLFGIDTTTLILIGAGIAAIIIIGAVLCTRRGKGAQTPKPKKKK